MRTAGNLAPAEAAVSAVGHGRSAEKSWTTHLARDVGSSLTWTAKTPGSPSDWRLQMMKRVGAFGALSGVIALWGLLLSVSLTFADSARTHDIEGTAAHSG